MELLLVIKFVAIIIGLFGGACLIFSVMDAMWTYASRKVYHTKTLDWRSAKLGALLGLMTLGFGILLYVIQLVLMRLFS